MDKIKELKSRLRYNQNNGFILTGKDIKTLIDYIEESNSGNSISNAGTNVLKLELTASEITTLASEVILDLRGTDQEIIILSVTADLVGTPMDDQGSLYVYVGTIDSGGVQMFSGSPCNITPETYYRFAPNNDTVLFLDNKQIISITSNSPVGGGDTDTLLTLYITYVTYAN